MREESKLRLEEEQAKRSENMGGYNNTMTDLSNLLETHTAQNSRLRDQNAQMASKMGELVGETGRISALEFSYFYSRNWDLLAFEHRAFEHRAISIFILKVSWWGRQRRETRWCRACTKRPNSRLSSYNTKYISVQFGQILFYNSNKYILQLGQILITIQTNTFCNLDE